MYKGTKKIRDASIPKTKIQEYKHQYYLKNKDRILNHVNCYRKEHPEKEINKDGYYSEYKSNIREQFFNMYGNKCSCCGETCKTFLVLDHIKGKNRRCKSKIKSYLDALTKYDPEEYRTLCHNCNQATSGGKICPHQLKEKEGETWEKSHQTK